MSGRGKGRRLGKGGAVKGLPSSYSTKQAFVDLKTNFRMIKSGSGILSDGDVRQLVADSIREVEQRKSLVIQIKINGKLVDCNVVTMIPRLGRTKENEPLEIISPRTDEDHKIYETVLEIRGANPKIIRKPSSIRLIGPILGAVVQTDVAGKTAAYKLAIHHAAIRWKRLSGEIKSNVSLPFPLSDVMATQFPVLKSCKTVINYLIEAGIARIMGLTVVFSRKKLTINGLLLRQYPQNSLRGTFEDGSTFEGSLYEFLLSKTAGHSCWVLACTGPMIDELLFLVKHRETQFFNSSLLETAREPRGPSDVKSRMSAAAAERLDSEYELRFPTTQAQLQLHEARKRQRLEGSFADLCVSSSSATGGI